MSPLQGSLGAICPNIPSSINGNRAQTGKAALQVLILSIIVLLIVILMVILVTTTILIIVMIIITITITVIISQTGQAPFLRE